MIFGTLTPSLPCTYGAGASNCQMGISGADDRGKDAKRISAGLISLLLAARTIMSRNLFQIRHASRELGQL
jgi:hypothetical protein